MADLLSAYPRAELRFDEMLDAAGAPRPHWARVVDALAGPELARVRDRIATTERQIRDSGLTYNMYADPKGADRPWALDTLLRSYVQTGGIIPNRIAGTDTAIKRSTTEIADFEKRLTAKEADLKRKYGIMEGALSDLEKNAQSLKNFSSGTSGGN